MTAEIDRPLFLSGPMGAGKSTVGKAVAKRVGATFLDLDTEIEVRAGRSIGELFGERGEEEFRALESSTLRELLETCPPRTVIALGGGAVLSQATRLALLERGVLVTLTAPLDVLLERVLRSGARPLLAGSNPRQKLDVVLQARAELYAECHAQVDAAAELDLVLEQTLRAWQSDAVVVPLGRRTYRVEFGGEIAARLARHLGTSRSVLLVTDENVEPHALRIESTLLSHGVRAQLCTLRAGEKYKNVRSVEQIWNRALEAGLDRGSAIVGVGGGVVGDLAGFAASTLLRGIGFIQVPTTLLSMVDSSVGGKTGFDHPRGKNLIGSFHQPELVLCDIGFLSTLPQNERIAGMAEVVKSAWIAGEPEVQALERDSELLCAGDLAATERAVRMSIALKARIVARDEHEQGDRALLNFGHTFGHAIEAASGYSIAHGEAVARGMMAAMKVSHALGKASSQDITRLAELLRALTLPTEFESLLDERALALLSSDKKRRGSHIVFIAAGGPGHVVRHRIELSKVLEWVRT